VTSELDEMTPRSFEALPCIDANDLIKYRDAGGRGTVVYPSWFGELPNRFFMARYSGVLFIGELGLYRVGELLSTLAPRPGVTLDDFSQPLH
jgi:hypothetical protein